MSLDLRNFVNIVINYKTIESSSVSQGIVTLITINEDYNSDPFKGLIFKSEQEYLDAKAEKSVSSVALDAYVASFFEHQGRALQIIGGFTTGTVKEFLVNVLKGLSYKHVIIVSDAEEEDLRHAAETSANTSVVKNPIITSGSIPTFSGINEKLFISSTTDTSGQFYDHIETGTGAPTFEANKYYQLTSGQYVKLATQPANWSTNYTDYFEIAECSLGNYLMKVGVKGIEMLAAAYVSQIDPSQASTVNDYAFTIEKLKVEGKYDFSSSLVKDNATGVKLIEAHFNFDSELVNSVRNYSGDTVKGFDVSNYYMKIILTQELSERIMNLLASKIKYNQAGINRLDNTISQVMSQYIENGYLNADYIWNQEDLYYTFKGVKYLVCARNTPLVKGYKSIILPLTSLSTEEKESHILPPVYILLADQTGIRAIVITGDVY